MYRWLVYPGAGTQIDAAFFNAGRRLLAPLHRLTAVLKLPLQLLLTALLLLVLAGCTTTARITNTPIDTLKPTRTNADPTDNVLFFMSFSGGGTRAAALSYGVLEELRDTTFIFDGVERRLLDEVDSISAVSGGSFTAAYYGLYGDRIFEDYEEKFLRYDVQKTLINSVLNPLNWPKMLFTQMSRTELAIDYYDKQIFNGGTFADMRAQKGPTITINASDLGIGERFSFSQSRFNIICSNLDDFSVARAVAASSAVPILFKPVSLQNYDTCDASDPEWLEYARRNMANNDRLRTWVESIDSYNDKESRPYIHLVDGGITDNLGVRSLYEGIEVAGGALRAAELSNKTPPKYIVVIVVNAATRSADPMDSSNKSPSTSEVIGAVSKTQISRYNLESIILLEDALERWSKELSTPEHTVTPYFIKLDFESISDQKIRLIFNKMPTSFSLPDEEVDNLIEAGHQLLRQSPDYQRLIALIKQAEQQQSKATSD